jgi:hypothetical protein
MDRSSLILDHHRTPKMDLGSQRRSKRIGRRSADCLNLSFFTWNSMDRPCLLEQHSSDVIHSQIRPLFRPLQKRFSLPFPSRPPSMHASSPFERCKLIVFSPTEVLVARRKVICPVCTVDDALPVMIEEGSEWVAHTRTKVHKRLAAKDIRATRTGPSRLSVEPCT